MEEKVNVWKANLKNGVILGMVGVIYSLLMYVLDLSFNQLQGYLFMVIQAVLLWYLLKSYRDNYLFGNITYGQSVGAGVIICFYYAIISAVFAYLLYTVIDPGLVDKQLAFAEEMVMARGLPQASVDAAMAIQRKLMTPGIIALMSIFGNLFWGTIISLIVGVFIKREGNPLIDPQY
jgi:hypothetical protein